MKRKIVIFVDAFPYTELHKIQDKIKTHIGLFPMRPIFGYSVNLKAALFSGQTPDQVGFFNEWMPSRHGGRQFSFKFLNFLDKLFPKFGGLLHKIYSRIRGDNYYRIPFHMKEYFSKVGLDAYSRKCNFNTMFSCGNYVKILYSDYHVKERDVCVFNEAINLIKLDECKDLFIAFAGLDEGMHTHGTSGEDFDNLIELYSTYVSQIWNLSEESKIKSDIHFISDHGMSMPKNVINLNFEDRFGRPGRDTYLYFIDSTMIRIWIYDKKMECAFDEFIVENKLIKLSTKERESFGITNPKFGDVIATVTDNDIFAPSFYGRFPCKGMHGYLPSYNSQLGVYVTNRHLNIERSEISPYQIYKNLVN